MPSLPSRLAPPPCPCLSTNHPVNKTSRADEGNEHVPSLPRAVHSRAAASRPPRHRDTPSPERHGTTASYESQSRPRTEQTVCTVRVDARRAESLLNQSPHRLVEVPTPPRPPGRCSPRREPCNPSHPATRTPTAPHAVHGMPNRTIPPSPPPCCRRPGPLCTSRNGRTSAPPNTLNRTRATPPPERSPTVAGRDSHPLRDGAFSRRTRPAVLVALTCIDRQRTHRSLPWCLPPGRQRRTQGNARQRTTSKQAPSSSACDSGPASVRSESPPPPSTSRCPLHERRRAFIASVDRVCQSLLAMPFDSLLSIR